MEFPLAWQHIDMLSTETRLKVSMKAPLHYLCWAKCLWVTVPEGPLKRHGLTDLWGSLSSVLARNCDLPSSNSAEEQLRLNVYFWIFVCGSYVSFRIKCFKKKTLLNSLRFLYCSYVWIFIFKFVESTIQTANCSCSSICVSAKFLNEQFVEIRRR